MSQDTDKDNAQLMATEMLRELEFLLDACTETVTREYNDGMEYEVEVIRAGEETVKRIRRIVAKARGEK